MLPTLIPTAHWDSFNTSITALFNKTISKVATKTTNLSISIPETITNATDSLNYALTAGHITNATVVSSLKTTTKAAGEVAATMATTTARHFQSSTFPTQTVATFMAGAAGAGANKNRATTIIVYPTVSPESIVIPIVSCIFGFPILALIVICCLRRRAKLARERDRRRNYDMQDHAVSLVRFSPIHRLNYRPSRAISLRPERSLSQGFTSLELDTVVEERCSDVEQTQTELLQAESPIETTSYKMSFSS